MILIECQTNNFFLNRPLIEDGSNVMSINTQQRYRSVYKGMKADFCYIIETDLYRPRLLLKTYKEPSEVGLKIAVSRGNLMNNPTHTVGGMQL